MRVYKKEIQDAPGASTVEINGFSFIYTHE